MDANPLDNLIDYEYLRTELQFLEPDQFTFEDRELFAVQHFDNEETVSVENGTVPNSAEKNILSLGEDIHLSSDPSAMLDEYSSPLSVYDSESFSMDQEEKASPTNKKQKSGLVKKRSAHRLKWTEEENEHLRYLVKKYCKKNWKQIAKELGTNRLDTECRQHFCRVLERKSVKGRWSSMEISRLVEAASYETDWSKIASKVGTRDRNQCILKWKQLNRISRGGREWSLEEHNLMVQLYKKFSPCWELIADNLGNGISADDVFYHYKLFSSYNCFN